MGFRFRKSIKLGGGFRINLSKSGVGYSWGTKGMRFTKSSNGRKRTTYSIPGTGISYVSESGKSKKKANSSKRTTSNPAAAKNRSTTTKTGSSSAFKDTLAVIYSKISGWVVNGWEKLKNGIRTGELTPLLKKIGMWSLTVLFAVAALAFMPSFSSLLFLIVAAFLAPVQKWQDIIKQHTGSFLHGKGKVIALVAAAVVAFALAPSTGTPDPESRGGTAPAVISATSIAADRNMTTESSEEAVERGTTVDSEVIAASTTTTTIETTTTVETTTTTTAVTTTTVKTTTKPTEEMVWIPTKGGKKYHSNQWCSNMNGPKYVTLKEAKRLGFTRCKKCY